MSYYFYITHDDEGYHGTYQGTAKNAEDVAYTSVSQLKNIASQCVDIKPADENVSVSVLDTSLTDVFLNFENLKSVDFSGFNFANEISLERTFNNCPNLASIEGLNVLQSSAQCFVAVSSSNNITIRNCKFTGASLSYMFTKPASAYAYDVTQDVHTIIFSDCEALNLTIAQSMIRGINDLTTINLSGLKVGDNLVDFSEAFKENTNLSSLTLPSCAGKFSNMLQNSSNEIEMKVTGTILDGSNVQSMFFECKCTTLNLSQMVWCSSLADGSTTYQMFAGLYNCITIYCESLNEKYNAWADQNYTFGYSFGYWQSSKLVGGNGTTFSSAHMGLEYARVDTEDNPGYFTDPQEGKGKVTVTIHPSGGGVSQVYDEGSTYRVVIAMTKDYSFNYYHLQAGGDRGQGGNSKNVTQNGQVITINGEYSTLFDTYEYDIYLNYEKSPYDPSNPDGTDDPYTPGDLDSDTIDDDKPSDFMDYSSSPMCEIFLPTDSQLTSIAKLLYNQGVTAISGNLMGISWADIIHSLRVIPCPVKATGTQQLKFTWLSEFFTVTALENVPYTKNNYVSVDLGSIHIDPFYNNFLDYRINTTLYLPFIGYVSLETYDVVDKTISINCQIDLISGDCVYKIYVDGSIKYQFTGNASYQLPVTSIDTTNVLLKPALSAVSSIAQLGVSESLGGASQTSTSTEHTSLSYSRKGMEQGVFEPTSKKRTETIQTTYQPSRAGYINEAIGAFDNLGQGASRGSALAGNSGFLGTNTPYIVLSYPNWAIPSNYGALNGYPCNKYLNLGELSGYTEVEAIHLHNIQCTQAELDEIDALLKGGVIL